MGTFIDTHTHLNPYPKARVWDPTGYLWVGVPTHTQRVENYGYPSGEWVHGFQEILAS